MLEADVLFRNARIVDGSGSDSYDGDILVAGDRIVAIGDGRDWLATETIDAAGLTACPGFIDPHSHDDRLLIEQPDMAPKVSQGVTTVIIGNCGLSLAPLTIERLPSPLYQLVGGSSFPDFWTYFAELEARQPATNVAGLVGHSSLRAEVMDDLTCKANAQELESMSQLCSDALAAGVVGMSSGLYYPPAQAADWEEVAALVKLVGAEGGIYPAHIRDEGDEVTDAIKEASRIATVGGAPLVISHHKVMGEANFGRSIETLALIDALSLEGKLDFDVYPYTAGASILLPRLVETSKRVVVASSEPYPGYAGQDLDDVASELGCSATEAAERLSPGTAVYFMMDEADVQRILTHPKAMIGSDGIPDEHPHPRLWGTFPRVLGHYSRELGLFRFEEAVRRMTSLPAQTFGLHDRGILRAGAFADLVLLDAGTVIDRATFVAPTSPSEGIRHVMVNGRFAWRDGISTGERPGRVLRRAGSQGQLEGPQ